MQPTTAKYLYKSIQDDRLAAASRDRRAKGLTSDRPVHARTGARAAATHALTSLVARFASAPQR
jgi:hypothetical protein